MEEYTPSQFSQIPDVPAADPAVSSAVLQAFHGTRFWVRFIAGLGFAMTMMIVLFSLAAIIMSLAGSDVLEMNPLEGLLIGLIYSLSGLVYAIPTIYLWNYGTAIQKLLHTPDSVLLVKTIETQRKFWKVIGIISLVWISLLVVSIGAMLLVLMFTVFVNT